MSSHFPRLNLDRPADLEHVLHAINQHAHKVAQMEFGSELERDKALKALVDKMIKRVSIYGQPSTDVSIVDGVHLLTLSRSAFCNRLLPGIS